MEQRESGSTATVGVVFSVIASVIDLLLLGVLWFVYQYQVPHFVKVFEDFDTELPALTRLMMSLPNGLLLLLFLGIGILLVFKEIVLRNAAVKLSVSLVIGVGLLAFAGTLFFALYLPLVSLIEKLS